MNKRAISYQAQPTKVDKGKSTANESKAKQQDNPRPFYVGRQDRGGPYQGKSKNSKWERPAAPDAPPVVQANMVGTTTRSRYQILKNLQQANLITMPAPPKRQPKHADPNLWCDYNKSIDHTTNECFTRKGEILRLIAAGQLTPFAQVIPPPKNNKSNFKQKPKTSTQSPDEEEIEELPEPEGKVNTITGGFNNAAARHGVHAINLAPALRQPVSHPPITFTMADYEGVEPHADDPVVVTLRIKNYDVHNVLIDQGSSADIIYGRAFDQMGFKGTDLQPYHGSLEGFTGERVEVRGYVEAETIFGTGPNIRRVTVRYLVLNCTATYNVLIGRQTINDIHAVVSTPHLKMKYPTKNGRIGVLAVDQKVAKECLA